jgi:hypothetical protein
MIPHAPGIHSPWRQPGTAPLWVAPTSTSEASGLEAQTGYNH